MRTLRGFCIALLTAVCVFAQTRGGGIVNPSPARGGGSAVFPGGVSGPGVQRTVGSVVHPGGNFPQIGIPFIPNGANRQFGRANRGTTPVYAYPVYVGGSYYAPYGGEGYYPQAPAEQQQPNVTVIYPPQPPTPVIIYPSTDNLSQAPAAYQAPPAYQPAPRPAAEEPASTGEAPHYLIAFKDHTIYSAVAYWVDGDTLHYFTTGNTHNQASLSLVDRDLTNRLNRESGIDLKLPPAK